MHGKWVFQPIPNGHQVTTAGAPHRWDLDVTRDYSLSQFAHHPKESTLSTRTMCFLIKEELMIRATDIRGPLGHRIKGFQGRAEVTQNGDLITVRAGGAFRTPVKRRHNGLALLTQMLEDPRLHSHWISWCSRYGRVF